MESKLGFYSNSCRSSAGTTGTTHVVPHRPLKNYRILNHLVSMVAAVAIIFMSAAGETNCISYIRRYPEVPRNLPSEDSDDGQRLFSKRRIGPESVKPSSQPLHSFAERSRSHSGGASHLGGLRLAPLLGPGNRKKGGMPASETAWIIPPQALDLCDRKSAADSATPWPRVGSGATATRAACAP